MNNKRNISASIKWILEVSRRFSKIDRKGRSAVTSFLSTLGICVGVMTLITVVGVMNGFQLSFIDSIMEISSCHIRVTGIPDEKAQDFLSFGRQESSILCIDPFYESQGLIVGKKAREVPVIVRGVEQNIMEKDQGFKKEMKMIRGSFDLSKENYIVLGSELATSLGVVVGSSVNLLALSGGKDVALFSQNRQFYVTGIFECGYLDINEAYGFISHEAAAENFGKDARIVYGIKLSDYRKDFSAGNSLKAAFPMAKVESWREYNRTFFGALRVEKNILMFLVLLIFLVVGINIFNGMRRLVYERRQEIAVLNALGGSKDDIQSIFIVQGFSSGFKGAFSGVLLGLLITINMHSIFIFVSKAQYYIELFFTQIFSPANVMNVQENPMFRVYAAIPARVEPSEVFFICIFGIAAPLFASWLASKNVLKMNSAEVLHDE